MPSTLVSPVQDPSFKPLNVEFPGCSDTEGKSISTTITIGFGTSGSFDVTKALSLGLDFGVSVSTTTTTSQSTTENCPTSGDDNHPCVCGLQFKVTKYRATGTVQQARACGPGTFDVTCPQQFGGFARTEWRSCRSSQSKCSQMASSPLCANGL
ncbi:MAG: hypothetical protein M1813_007763 [Trichoglossum hirsutum]|nr:MAG: hypothetical protein M1813_007763 [Trichoglossum hirsutum]